MALPVAWHTGEVKIGNVVLPCAVLEDGTRLITQRGVFNAIGRTGRSSGTPEGTASALPVFLRAKNLSPFITDELRTASAPIKFRQRTPKNESNALGFRAEILPLTCHVFIEAFNAAVLSNRQVHIAETCRSLAKGFAIVGITALIDEATGYQEIRDRKALQDILDRYLRKDFAAWAKRFPDEFYQQIFRLRGWQWRGMKVNRPGVVANYTKDLVYARLAPGVLAELERLNPIDEGRRQVKHHQFLTTDIGHPALQAHLNGVVAIMRGSTTWPHAQRMIQRAYPKINTNLDLPFPDDADDV
jgi:P63C domain